MDLLLTIGINLIMLLVGYILGMYPYRKSSPYEDMKELTNQFANLSVQLTNTIKDNQTQMSFEPMKYKEEVVEEEDGHAFADLEGGRL